MRAMLAIAGVLLSTNLIFLGWETALPLHAPLSDPLMQTSCRVDDEAVSERLRPYRRLFRTRSLTPPPAFAHFASATERLRR